MPSFTSLAHGGDRRARTLVTAAIVLSLVFGVTAARATTTPPTPAAPTTTFDNHMVESFSASGWWNAWGLTTMPWHTTMVTEAGNQFLRVNFPAGSHNGTSFDWLTGTADAAHIQYRIRLSSNWQSAGAKLPGFGDPTYNADGTCSGGCGLAPANGITSWSARGHLNRWNVPGSYLYTPSKTEWTFQWDTSTLVPGKWYTIDYWVTMNTPGQSDGILSAAVNGQQVFRSTDMTFRLVDSLHVGKAWFGFYYGGTSTPMQNMWIDVDDITVDW
ncbi:MAG TPA: hypothetical protein VFV00_12095 [Acidimicrobiales bacterium]|nr:hypothetical protein [Acidimicrobiales bacterium]